MRRVDTRGLIYSRGIEPDPENLMVDRQAFERILRDADYSHEALKAVARALGCEGETESARISLRQCDRRLIY